MTILTTQTERAIDNPIIKDRVTFIKTGTETGGEYLLLKLELAAQGGNPLHYHLTFTETFTVLEGRLDVILGDEHKVLEAGQSVIALPKIQHRFFNLSEAPTTCIVEIRPARQFEKALRVSYGLARDGRTNRQAIPTNLWQLALVFQLAETYLPGVPWQMQREVMGLMAWIAKRLGKDKGLEKYCDTTD